ncbi:hypothetical protein ACLMJK_002712 [Lecanora helva]
MTTQPFSKDTGHNICNFLEILPLEIRQEIYYHVFLQPSQTIRAPDEADLIVSPNRREILHNKVEAAAVSREFTIFWGTEEMTRLLRVCHQVHDEAISVLYSRITFCWPLYTSVSFVKAVLKRMSLVAREQMRHVGLFVLLDLNDGETPDVLVINWKKAFIYLAKSLPALISVRVSFEWMDSGARVTRKSKRLFVERALDMMSPFNKVQKLTVNHKMELTPDSDRDQRIEMARELKWRAENGHWRFDADPKNQKPLSA